MRKRSLVGAWHFVRCDPVDAAAPSPTPMNGSALSTARTTTVASRAPLSRLGLRRSNIRGLSLSIHSADPSDTKDFIGGGARCAQHVSRTRSGSMVQIELETRLALSVRHSAAGGLVVLSMSSGPGRGQWFRSNLRLDWHCR